MNKFGFIVGVTATAALVGCIDPEWAEKHSKKATSTPSAAETPKAVEPVDNVVQTTPVQVEPAPTIDVVDTGSEKPLQPVFAGPVSSGSGATSPVTPGETAVAAAPETTTYIIQSGDSISKISKRYNIKVDAIKAANPNLKDVNKIRLGQKIQLPGRIDVGSQSVPAGAFAPPPAAKPSVPYTGATRDYVVQKGDYLGKIALKNGCTVRQIKELNGMTTDTIAAGRKIKVPAGAAVAKPEAKTVPPPAVEPSVEPAPADNAAAVAEPDSDAAAVPEAAPAPEAAPVPEAAPTAEFDFYEVKDGEDITSISINFDVSPAEIRQINNLDDGAVLVPGQKLKLPAGTVR